MRLFSYLLTWIIRGKINNWNIYPIFYQYMLMYVYLIRFVFVV
jgi:hypothetical protein